MNALGNFNASKAEAEVALRVVVEQWRERFLVELSKALEAAVENTPAKWQIIAEIEELRIDVIAQAIQLAEVPSDVMLFEERNDHIEEIVDAITR